MPHFLIGLFFITALLYSSVGFGGGSTYNALLILSGADFRIVPVIALACNIVVVMGNAVRYAASGYLRWKALAPGLLVSVPLAWIGGSVSMDERSFSALLGIILLLTAITMFFQERWQLARAADINAPVLILFAVGAACGFVAGLVGIGGGIFLAPCLYAINWGSEKSIAAACSLFILLNSISGMAGQVSKLESSGLLELATPYWPLIPAVMIGGWIGNRYGVLSMNPGHVRKGTALLILVVAMRLLWTTVRELNV